MGAYWRIPLASLGAFLLAACETVITEFEDYTVPEGARHSVLDSRLERLEKLAEEYPRRPDYPYEIAAIHFRKAEFKESAAALEQAIYLDPDQARYHYHLGRVYLRMREFAKAEQAFRRAVELTPRDRYSGTHAALGYVLALEKRLEAGLEQFEKCIAIDPDVAVYYYFLGAIHDMLGHERETIRYFREYLARGGAEYRKRAIFLLRRLGVEIDESALPPPAPRSGSAPPYEFDPSGEQPFPGEG